MKVLFIVSTVLIGLAFTTFTPEWADCGSGRGWVMHNVTLDKEPAVSEKVAFEICGENSNFYVIPFTKMQVTAGDFLNDTIPEKVNVVWKQDYCFSYDAELPSTKVDPLVFVFQLQAQIFGAIGCANVTLHL